MTPTSHPMPRHPRRLLRGVAVAFVGLFGLSACGQVAPGTAARIGDDRISTSEVTDVAEGYCDFYERSLKGEGQAFPMSALKQFVVQSLIVTRVADQLADAYGVTAGETYNSRVASLEQSTSVAPADQAEAVIAVESAQDYVTGVAAAVGAQLLAADGIAEPGYEDSVARGIDQFKQWIEAEDIVIDPSYDLELVDGTTTFMDKSTSLAVSDIAKAGSAQQPEQTFAASLPQSQRCG